MKWIFVVFVRRKATQPRQSIISIQFGLIYNERVEYLCLSKDTRIPNGSIKIKRKRKRYKKVANKIHLYLEKPDIQQHLHAISTQEMRINIHTAKRERTSEKKLSNNRCVSSFFSFPFLCTMHFCSHRSTHRLFILCTIYSMASSSSSFLPLFFWSRSA